MQRLERGLQRGIAAFRWLAWVWMATVLLLARGALERPVAAVSLVIAALAVTVWLTLLLRRAPDRLTAPSVVGTEVGVALALLVADGFVYAPPHVFTGSQPLGVAWPLAGLLAAGVAFGPTVGAVTGIAAGAARAASSVSNVVPVPLLVPDAEPLIGALTAVQVLSLVTSGVLYALAGGIAGYGSRVLRDAQQRLAQAERRVAAARAREEVARRLHDGVLQTLAVVERRAEDPRLVALAHDQQRDLRRYLLTSLEASDTEDGRGWTAARLRDALLRSAARFETAFDGRVEVLVPDDLEAVAPTAAEAVVGAVGEALTNAGRHGGASRVVVYVEPADEGVFVAVRDDGCGFDPALVRRGMGLDRSIEGRIVDLGGNVEVDAAPGRGTEVRLRLPRTS